MTDSRTLSTTAQVTTCILSLYTGFGRIFTIQDLWSTNKDPSTKLEQQPGAPSLITLEQVLAKRMRCL